VTSNDPFRNRSTDGRDDQTISKDTGHNQKRVSSALGPREKIIPPLACLKALLLHFIRLCVFRDVPGGCALQANHNPAQSWGIFLSVTLIAAGKVWQNHVGEAECSHGGLIRGCHSVRSWYLAKKKVQLF